MKTFARQMVKDHGGAQSELQATAKGSGAAVPTTLDQEHQARLKALRSKSGADFDKAYVADQGENHSNALTLYADYMLWGEYEKLHALAIKMIPITEAQLKQAQVLAGDDPAAAPTLADARSFRYPRRAGRRFIHVGKSGHHRLRHRLGRR